MQGLGLRSSLFCGSVPALVRPLFSLPSPASLLLLSWVQSMSAIWGLSCELLLAFRYLGLCLPYPFQCKWSFESGFGSAGFCLWLTGWLSNDKSSYHFWGLGCIRQCTKHLTHASLSPHVTRMRQVLLSSLFYRWRCSGLEKLGNRGMFEHTTNSGPSFSL